MIQLQPSETTKTLGIVWGPVSDKFSFYGYKLTSQSTSITKRIVLSDLAGLYDPIGIINPIVVLGKIFLQELWIRKVNRDEALPQNLHTQWQRFRNDLGSLEQIQVPRFVLTVSQRSYELRSTDIGGKSEIRLLCAKSRIVPVKTVSLPKLELCAALLLPELIDRRRSTICITVHKIFCWTDSRIVLDWLSSHASNWNSFVSNRVAKIQEISVKISWNHVDSKTNPADIVYRGMLPEELASSELWFQGPSFLRKPEEMWPKSKTLNISVADIPEMRRSTFTFLATTLEKPGANNIVDADHFFLDINYLNHFRKLQRIISFMFRFIQNIRRPRSRKPRLTEPFSAEGLDTSLKRMVWAVQQTAFGTEIRDLERISVVGSKSCLRTLNPFLADNSGIQLLKVGGRLQNADITHDAKHPILLPKSHPFVQSLVKYYHTKNFHAGTFALTAFVRQQYWVLNSRSIAKKVVFGCYRCFRSKPMLAEQIMGNLPAHRVTPAGPFINCGVDFCGHFLIRHQLHGKHPYKIYVAVFVCFATKAIHMEIVSDLSSKAFIATLKRFVARRGHIRHLYCDNGTNFVGARRELKELQEQYYKQETKDAVWRYCAEDGIDFYPNPARSPHFGGLWEAAVKSTKTLIFKTINMASLTYEELHTVIVQIEAILNSRPLTALSPDPADLEPLTPGHFLIGALLTTLVEPSLLDVNFSCLSRWQRVWSLQQQFWAR